VNLPSRQPSQAEVGVPVAEVCRKAGVTEQTLCLWKKRYCSPSSAPSTMRIASIPGVCFPACISGPARFAGTYDRPCIEMAVIGLQLEQIQPNPGLVRPNTNLLVAAEKATRFLARTSTSFSLNT
jgi:Transposase